NSGLIVLKFKVRNYQLSLAFRFAIEEINRNTHILPNLSLGFELYNVNSNQWETLKNPFVCLTGMGISIPNYTCRRQKVVALLTGTAWATSAQIGRLLSLYKYPQLHPFLRNIHFKNGAENLVVLNSQRKADEEYDIINFWNFPENLRQEMKVGTYSPRAPQGQKLFLSEHK
ncbi:hypothetical protein STEG23_012663, partial [Scotinomys teguina]